MFDQRIAQLRSELDRAVLEHARIQDYNQPLAWLNALGEADWEVEKYLIEKEIKEMEEINQDKFTAESSKQVARNRNAGLLNMFSELCASANRKWDLDLKKPCKECGGLGKWEVVDDTPITCAACNGRGYALRPMNVGEKLMLCVSEIAEAGEDSPQYNAALFELVKSLSRAMEGHRKQKMDDKLPHRDMLTVELADLLIRVFHLCGFLQLDIGGAFVEKMQYNLNRADHTLAARTAEGGKKY